MTQPSPFFLKPQVPVGIGPPNALTITVNSSTDGPDLTTVTGATCSGRRVLDLFTFTWAVNIVGKTTSTQLTLQHPFATTDCPIISPLELAVSLTVAGGIIPTYTADLDVVDPFECRPSPELVTSTFTTLTLSQSASPSFWYPIAAAQSPFTASSGSPWILVDCSAGPVTVDLWTPVGPDFVVIGDRFGKQSLNPITVVAGGSYTIQDPQSPGSYSSSVLMSDPGGAPLRLKAAPNLGIWTQW